MFTLSMSTNNDDRNGAAREVCRELVDDEFLDRLLASASDRGVGLTGVDGVLPELIKAVLERGMEAELSAHLGYEKHDPAGRGSGNSRNGTTPKTVATQVGPIDLDRPRDRNGTFTSQLVPNGQRRLDGLDETIISLYAGGMTIRDIQHHLAATVGTELSHETISNITEAVADEVLVWQNRALERFYPVIFMDAISVKIREQNRVQNRSAHIAVGIDIEGIKHVLGIWVQAHEGAKFWAGVCAQLANRGIQDVLIVATDGLPGFAEAIEATWPNAVVQTCVVHLIRASMRYVSYQDRKQVAARLRPIYTAVDADAAQLALAEFAESQLGKKYPMTVKTWQNAWERFIPFLAFGPATRKVIYTTNSIESLNYQLRKIIKNRGHFPNDAAAVKLLWLAICGIEDKQARQRAKETKTGKSSGRLIEGRNTQSWQKALGELALHYPDRFPNH